MSRTVRRKSSPVPEYVTTDWVRGSLNYWRRVPLEGKELVKSINKHHSDHGYRNYGGWCPSWFRRELNRLYRSRDNAEIHRINIQGDYEEYLFNPRRKDCAWLWW